MLNKVKMTSLVALLIGLLIVPSLPGLAEEFPDWWDEVDPALQEWAKEAEVGPYEPEDLNWEAIEEAAKEEGEVVVYSQSSRIETAGKEFEEKYPQIDVKGQNMYVYELMSKWGREMEGGVYNVDVIFAGAESTMINEYLVPPDKNIWNFYPELVKEKWLDKQYYEPLNIIRVTLQPVFYNPNAYDEPPIDNLWDLTKPEWEGKILIMDPTVDPFALNWLTTIVGQPEALREAYQKEFGEELILDPAIEHAGYQWLNDFLKNNPVTVASDDAVAEGVGEGNSEHLGLAAFYSKYRWALEGRVDIEPIHDIEPYAGTQTFTYLGISSHAPHPNAAKLFIKEMVGTEEDPVGVFTPWHVPGDFKPRVDISAPEGMPGGLGFADLAPNYAPNDPKFIYENELEVRDFWLIRS